MPHYNGSKSSERTSPEHKLRYRISAKLSDARKFAEALLTQSNDDEEETKFYFAKLRRRLVKIRKEAAQLAVFPDHMVKHPDPGQPPTPCSPLSRAKEILKIVEDLESKTSKFANKFFELPLNHAEGKEKIWERK